MPAPDTANLWVFVGTTDMKTPEERIHDLELWQTRIVTGVSVLGLCILAFLGYEKWLAVPAMVNQAAEKEVQKQIGPPVLEKIHKAVGAADKVIALQNVENTFTVNLDPQHAMPRRLIGAYVFSCFIPTESDAPAVGSIPGESGTNEIALLLIATLQHKATKEWGVYIRVDFKGQPRDPEHWQMSVNVVQPGSQRKSTATCQPYAPSDYY